MSIKDMLQRLASGETIEAANTDNGLQFDVAGSTISPEGYQTYSIYINGQHRQSACVPQDAIDEWANSINERTK